VFDEIRQFPFTIKEAAEYFEVAEITVRRWIKSGKLKVRRIGRNAVLDADELKRFKRSKNAL
jgi:excisionase family DNA binding protein